MNVTKRKRRRKRRYKTGTHKSSKCANIIKYRSGWEYEVIKSLDADSNVISYSYETIQIPYLSNSTTGKFRIYYPDFFVEYADGSKKLIEVKRQDKITQLKTAKKLKAGQEWCKIHGIGFEIWADEKIKKLTEANKLIYPAPTVKKKKRKKVKKQ